MKTDIYLAIVDRLKDNMPEIKHYDLWNRQLDPDYQNRPQIPAIFIEFMPNTYKSAGGRKKQITTLRIRLHLVTESLLTTKDRPDRNTVKKSLVCFELIDRMHYLLEGWSGNRDVFGSLSRMASATDHYNAGVRDDIEDYGCVANDVSAVRATTKLIGDKYKATVKII